MSINLKFATITMDDGEQYVSAVLINDQYKTIFRKSGSTQMKLIKELKLSQYIGIWRRHKDRIKIGSIATKILDNFKSQVHDLYLNINELKTPKEGEHKYNHIELLRLISLLPDIEQPIVENKPTKLLRKTTIMYFISLTITFALLFAMSGEKEYMLLNVNKDTELYKIKDGNVVSNNYLLLFQNTESKTLTYELEIVDNPDIKITRFEPFTLSPGKMAKKVVILETDKLLVDNNLKDTPITVTIKAYAKEDPEKIKVFRKATFFFPRSDKLQK